LRPADVVRRNGFAIADYRIHDRIHVLTILIRVRQAKRVSEFVNQDPTNIANRISA